MSGTAFGLSGNRSGLALMPSRTVSTVAPGNHHRVRYLEKLSIFESPTSLGSYQWKFLRGWWTERKWTFWSPAHLLEWWLIGRWSFPPSWQIQCRRSARPCWTRRWRCLSRSQLSSPVAIQKRTARQTVSCVAMAICLPLNVIFHMNADVTSLPHRLMLNIWRYLVPFEVKLGPMISEATLLKALRSKVMVRLFSV